MMNNNSINAAMAAVATTAAQAPAAPKLLADEVKTIAVGKGVTVNRRITLRLTKKLFGGGMEAAGDVFDESGRKTGFYRYQSRYAYPIFFSAVKRGLRICGNAPLTAAIKEVVHEWAAAENAARHAKVEEAQKPVAQPVEKKAEEADSFEEIIKEAVSTPIESFDPRKELKEALEEDGSLDAIDLADLGFTPKQVDAIIDYEEEHEVKSLKDLLKVKGVGPKAIKKAEKNLGKLDFPFPAE
jgi:hypothetical protein